MQYHKLVRDRIPEIIEASGKTCTWEILSDEVYLQLLDEKLNEELSEYQESKSLEELADLLEVVQAVVRARGWTPEQLEQLRADKAAQRGGFEKRILWWRSTAFFGATAPATMEKSALQPHTVRLVLCADSVPERLTIKSQPRK